MFTAVASVTAAFVGMFGWSHTHNKKRIDAMQREYMRKDEIKELVTDKLAVLKAQQDYIQHRLSDIEYKIDTLIKSR